MKIILSVWYNIILVPLVSGATDANWRKINCGILPIGTVEHIELH